MRVDESEVQGTTGVTGQQGEGTSGWRTDQGEEPMGSLNQPQHGRLHSS